MWTYRKSLVWLCNLLLVGSTDCCEALIDPKERFSGGGGGELVYERGDAHRLA